MAPFTISETKTVAASPDILYAILADYEYGHPYILPTPPFVDLAVEQGGSGAGTIIRFRMRVLGQTHTLRAVVSEPEPGRVLVETNDNGSVTTFTVDPHGTGAQVTIATTFPGHTGPLGALESWFMRRMLVPVYGREIDMLAAFAVSQKYRAAG